MNFFRMDIYRKEILVMHIGKYSTEIVLCVILILIGLVGIHSDLQMYMNSYIGKIFMLTILVGITGRCGLSCGLLGMLIIIFVLHTSYEGFKEGNTCSAGTKDDDESNDNTKTNDMNT